MPASAPFLTLSYYIIHSTLSIINAPFPIPHSLLLRGLRPAPRHVLASVRSLCKLLILPSTFFIITPPPPPRLPSPPNTRPQLNQPE